MTERQRFEAWYAREDARWLNTSDAAFMAWCAAIAAEREACAQLCDDMVLYTGFDCAAKIVAPYFADVAP